MGDLRRRGEGTSASPRCWGTRVLLCRRGPRGEQLPWEANDPRQWPDHLPRRVRTVGWRRGSDTEERGGLASGREGRGGTDWPGGSEGEGGVASQARSGVPARSERSTTRFGPSRNLPVALGVLDTTAAAGLVAYRSSFETFWWFGATGNSLASIHDPSVAYLRMPACQWPRSTAARDPRRFT
jgi:hypothetical protein